MKDEDLPSRTTGWYLLSTSFGQSFFFFLFFFFVFFFSIYFFFFIILFTYLFIFVGRFTQKK